MDRRRSVSLEDRLRDALGSHVKRSWVDPSQRAAAVMLLVFERGGEPWTVFTKRTHTVRHHKGEISFPGGMRDTSDAGLLETALRETHEELGIDPALVTVVGELDDLPTFATGYLVSPFVAVVPSDHTWSPSAEEIAEVIELPVRELLRVARSDTFERDGIEFPMHIYDVNGYYIWGLTGKILHQFLDVVSPALGLDGLDEDGES